MITILKKLLRDERGAITTDWTALTAGVLTFGMLVVWLLFSEGVAPMATSMGDSLESIDVPSAVAMDKDVFSIRN